MKDKKDSPDRLQPVYLLAGGDSFSKKKYLEELAGKIQEKFGSGESISYYGGATDSSEIINEILSGSLFSTHKIVIVNQAEKFFSKKESGLKEFISGYSKKKEYPATLMLITDMESLAVGGSPGKKLFRAPYENQMPAWISQRVRNSGKRISPRAAALISFRCGRNLRAADAELQKAVLSYPGKKEINVEDVEKVAGIYKKEDIFGYLDALLSSDMKKGLKILKNLMSFGSEPLRIVAMLKWRIQQMIQVRVLMEKGNAEKEIIKKLSLRPAFLYRGICSKMKNFSLEMLIQNYGELMNIDLKLKTSSADEGLVLEKFTVKFLSG